MTGQQAILVHEPAIPEEVRLSCVRADGYGLTSVDATRDPIDEAVEESFPASDPPTWTPIVGPRIDATGTALD